MHEFTGDRRGHWFRRLTPEQQAEHVKKMQAGRRKLVARARRAKAQWTPERRAQHSELMKAKWAEINKQERPSLLSRLATFFSF